MQPTTLCYLLIIAQINKWWNWMQERLCGVNCNDYSLKRQNFIYLCHSGAYYYYYNFPHHFMSHPLLPLRVNISFQPLLFVPPRIVRVNKVWTFPMDNGDEETRPTPLKQGCNIRHGNGHDQRMNLKCSSQALTTLQIDVNKKT